MKRFIITSILLFEAFFSYSQNAQLKVACVGNSITFGAFIENNFQNSYPGILQQNLGNGYDVRNFGVSGTTLLKKGDYPYMSTGQYRQALDFKPDIVTIKLGTNDSKPHNWIHSKDFEKDLTELVQSFRNLDSNPKIFLCLPIPSTVYSRNTINDSTIVAGVIPVIKRVAKRQNIEIIDLYSLMKEHPELIPDTIHPNAEGSALIAAEIYKHITGEDFTGKYDVSQPFPGKKSDWHGGERYDFVFKGRHAIVVKPKNPAKGNPWIWRPAFFDAFPSVDVDLLQKGFHIAYYDLTHLYGSPRSVRLGDEFYSTMCSMYHLSDKVTLEGLSRGGYFVFNWAARNPSKVACIYVDAPVCDIESWPGRTKNPQLWNDFLKEWGVKDSEVDSSFRGNALQLLKPLADAGIPIMGVCGDSDDVVPFDENYRKVREMYVGMGGTAELILKPGCGHHPHSLVNPEPVSDFISRYQKGYTDFQSINYRGGLENAFSRFNSEKKGCVAFFGGSITEMKGWKDQVEEDLRQRFPDCEFNFIEAGIASLGSVPHSFRMEEDVFSRGIPDLLFVEAAVNDDTNEPSHVKQLRGMEGIIRHALQTNPYMDIVMLHFIYDPFIEMHKDSRIPDVILNHERVANHYGITSVDMSDEILTRMDVGQLTWQEFGGTHPSWNGHKFYTAAINRIFDREMRILSERNYQRIPHRIPEKPIDPQSYFGGTTVDVSKAESLKGFSVVDNWQSSLNVGTRRQYVGVPILEARSSGASLVLNFKGRGVGLYMTCGPNAAKLEYSIDGGEYRTIDTYTIWSSGLYIPWVYVLDDNLSSDSHQLRLRVAKGDRTECQIFRFVVNR